MIINYYCYRGLFTPLHSSPLVSYQTTGSVSGDIFFNGFERTAGFVKRTAYVQQDNVHYAMLTVLQTVTFAAELRLDNTKFTPEMKKARVDEVIRMMGLEVVANSLVGNVSIRGLSGGQLRRLTIAVELVHLPSVMFFDEPT